MRIAFFVCLICSTLNLSCQSIGGAQVAGNERGSQPVNEQEANDYKRAILKCYKTGGTRVVKINGALRCFN